VNNEPRRVILWRPIAALVAGIALVLSTLLFEPRTGTWQVNAEVVLLIFGTVLTVYGIRVLRRPRDRAEDRG
jgi:hypothetical protein